MVEAPPLQDTNFINNINNEGWKIVWTFFVGVMVCLESQAVEGSRAALVGENKSDEATQPFGSGFGFGFGFSEFSHSHVEQNKAEAKALVLTAKYTSHCLSSCRVTVSRLTGLKGVNPTSLEKTKSTESLRLGFGFGSIELGSYSHVEHHPSSNKQQVQQWTVS